MEHTKHIVRAVLLLVVVAVLFVLVRELVYPRSFGIYGHYRYDSVAEYAGALPVHGAPGTCVECHDEQGEDHSSGKHAVVSCEVCHDALAVHVKGDEVVAPMPAHRSVKLCAHCHALLTARPMGFPQVVIAAHVSEKGGEMAEAVCLECHDAHNPGE